MCSGLFTPRGVNDGNGSQAHGNSHEQPPEESRRDRLVHGGMRKLIESSEHASRYHERTEQTGLH